LVPRRPVSQLLPGGVPGEEACGERLFFSTSTCNFLLLFLLVLVPSPKNGSSPSSSCFMVGLVKENFFPL
jgi:hypothetical protein